ncbi:translin-associated factor X-interacting protein 1 isoform X2 [Rissa tridactyla]|uniref:translin-associated factor X-interacting protein 1 isoform X2 n=1 Tax=Rissa tridactyla TaxID=75485 RepID=UPI0023BA8902|nr:translin-associated factor X-interacting protein 1 isoform X2 [Rissa tridactyla]
MAARRAPPGGTAPDSSSGTPDCQTRINSLKYILSKKQKALFSARGHWSTWPAFGSEQTILGNHKPCCAPEERRSSNKQALLTVPKPRYLEELESYLRKELRSLDLTKNNSQELKLQPYREIFEFFIDNFKTYKPLLSAIKNEYEVTLAHQKKTIRALEPLKAMVTTVSDECTQRILALQEKEKDEIHMLKQEKQRLLKFIDDMKEEKSSLQAQMKALREGFDQLRKEYETLLEIHRETAQERDNFCAQLQRVQQNRTPRPNWAKCSEVIPGGAERWDCLAEGKTSEELVDVLLEEIGTGALREINVFPGWGKGDKVPVYLRHEGEVKNKKLTKKDVVNTLKDVWKEKIALEQQTGERCSLPEFFLSYLQKKYGDAAAMEWSYTLYENMRLCQSNHVLSSFYDVLTGKVDEEHYRSQNQLISNLQKELAARDSSNSGSLTSQQFSTAVREAFPLKRKESIQELVDASRYRLDGTEDLINYISLFKEDEEGNAAPFIAKLRSQYVREKQEYLRQLKNKLGDLTEVKADDLKAAFCSIDPDIDGQTLDTYVGLASQAGREELDREAVPVGTVLERLLTGDVRRVGPSPVEGSTAGFEGE